MPVRSFSEGSGIRGRQADSHQFQTCLVIFGIKGDDEDDDTDANPAEGDDWVIKAKQLSYVPPLMADDDGSTSVSECNWQRSSSFLGEEGEKAESEQREAGSRVAMKHSCTWGLFA